MEGHTPVLRHCPWRLREGRLAKKVPGLKQGGEGGIRIDRGGGCRFTQLMALVIKDDGQMGIGRGGQFEIAL